MAAALPMILTAGSAVMDAIGSMREGQSQAAMYAYQAQVARNNAMMAQRNAEAERQRGQAEEQQQRLKTAQLMGAQRAAAAGHGIDPNEGSALKLYTDSAALGEQDALTIRDNAARRAYGYEAQGVDFTNQATLDTASGKNARAAGYLGAVSSIIGGASSVSDKWAKFKSGGLT